MKEDHFTNTPKDAAAYEQYRAGDDYEEPRPTLAELQRDEGNEFDKAVGCCSIGPLKLHTMNYEKTECYG